MAVAILTWDIELNCDLSHDLGHMAQVPDIVTFFSHILGGILEHLNYSAYGGGQEPNVCFQHGLRFDSLFLLCCVLNEVQLEELNLGSH